MLGKTQPRTAFAGQSQAQERHGKSALLHHRCGFHSFVAHGLTYPVCQTIDVGEVPVGHTAHIGFQNRMDCLSALNLLRGPAGKKQDVSFFRAEVAHRFIRVVVGSHGCNRWRW